MNILSFARRVFAVSAAALCAAPLAVAGPVQLDPTGFATGSYESFSVHTAIVDPVATGAFAGTLDGSPIIFFCFELTQTFSFNPSPPYYTYDDELLTLTDATKANYLSELFTEAFTHALDSASNSAAFQLAVWEILGETTPGDVNSPDGNFYVTDNHGNTTTQNNANTLLANLPPTGTYVIHLLHSGEAEGNHQDFIYGVPPLLQQTPEPASLLLIGAALGAMFFGLRKRFQATRLT